MLCVVQKFQGEGVKTFQILKSFGRPEALLVFVTQEHFKFSLNLFERGGSKSGVNYAMSSTKVSGGGCQNISDLEIISEYHLPH